jgi:16S rRNA (uracil1498-N3)-methyltransferase
MPRFFVDEISGDFINITGEDAKHISKSLRMTVDDEITVCYSDGYDYICKIKDITKDEVILKIEEKIFNETEPKTKLTLYQSLPKGEKMELIIQKCVELGISKIVPVITSRTISRPDDKSKKKKILRWQKIAEEAAKQSGRGIIPEIADITDFKIATAKFLKSQNPIVFYELGGKSVKEILKGEENEISIMIGSEGGFSQEEIDSLIEGGANVATLGKRILRCETAPITATSVIMFQMGEMD